MFGLPVIGIHGGPGGGSSPEMRRFFEERRLVALDQLCSCQPAELPSTNADTRHKTGAGNLAAAAAVAKLEGPNEGIHFESDRTA